MKKTVIIIGILILTGLILFIAAKPMITGAVINKYSYTKAICNNTNFCQDHEIICNNGEVLRMYAISGTKVQHPANWSDPRGNEANGPLC